MKENLKPYVVQTCSMSNFICERDHFCRRVPAIFARAGEVKPFMGGPGETSLNSGRQSQPMITSQTRKTGDPSMSRMKVALKGKCEKIPVPNPHPVLKRSGIEVWIGEEYSNRTRNCLFSQISFRASNLMASLAEVRSN